MNNFVSSSKILIDREFLLCQKELAKINVLNNGPRIKFSSSKEWKTLCDESLDSLAHGLGHYIEDNIVCVGFVNLRDNLPMVLPRLEEEINEQLKICLIHMTQNKLWATKRAKEISLSLGASFASFGGGVGLSDQLGPAKTQIILNYIMTFIICLLQAGSTGDNGIDSIPIIVCHGCKKDMPLGTPPIGVSRDFDLCDDCEIMYLTQ